MDRAEAFWSTAHHSVSRSMQDELCRCTGLRALRVYSVPSVFSFGHSPECRSIELYGREVIPRVRELVASRQSPVPSHQGRAVAQAGD
jgi:xanthine dehydrogenase iron-sulfur cluster and FAD-binding subunit A